MTVWVPAARLLTVAALFCQVPPSTFHWAPAVTAAAGASVTCTAPGGTALISKLLTVCVPGSAMMAQLARFVTLLCSLRNA